MPTFSIRKLTITNFRTVKGTVELDFDQPPGLYFIAGRNLLHPRLGANDAGKSTLFCESLSWLLQGRTSRSNRPGSDIVNWAAEGDSAGVKGLFVLGGVPYTLERYRNPNRLLLNGAVAEQRDIDKLLPLSDSALRRTLLIDQFGTMFLGLKPEDKSRIFSETLDLDNWVKASERASTLYRAAEATITGYENSIGETSAAITVLRDQLTEAETREQDFEDELNRMVTRLVGELDVAICADKASKEELNKARAANQVDPRQVIELNDYIATEKRLINRKVEAQASLAITEREIERLTERLRQYRSAGGVCPECGQKVSDEHLNTKADEVRVQLRQARSGEGELKQMVEELTGQIDAIRLMITQLEENTRGHDAAQAAVSIAAAKSLNDQREVNRLRRAVEEARNQVNPFSDLGDKLVAQLNAAILRRRELRAELSRHQAKVEVYKFWTNGFREIRLDQIDTTLAELEMAANRHGEALGLDSWEIQFATERETQSGSLSHKFSVFLFPPGQTKPVAWENYAGGVSQRWQLAVTAALSEILLARAGIDTDFEVLDEPTIHLSPEGIEDLLDCLKERAAELNRRIFIIDHHALDKGVFDDVLTVVKDTQGVVSVERKSPM